MKTFGKLISLEAFNRNDTQLHLLRKFGYENMNVINNFMRVL